MKLSLHILTPDKEVLKEEVDEVLVPTVNGELGILPNHVSLLTQIQPGELITINSGKRNSYAITGGYLEVNNNQVNVLGDYAIRSEDIEISKAEEAKKKAEAMMKDKESVENFAEIEAQLRRSLLELKVAQRRRRPQ
ncbi:MAG: F0F1 ATP synthase subunit epsilon [uncultured bacterium]|nr:MAG: F0F1 ATP synthase subunit epsilon [uncultured bacterium]